MASAQSIIDARSERLAGRFRGAEVHPASLTPSVAGRVVRMIGLKIEAAGCTGAVGSRCLVRVAPNRNIVAEIVGFSDGRLVLMPESSVDGLAIGAPVIPLEEENAVAVGEEMMGRVLDGAGQFIDGGGDLLSLKRTALRGEALNPLSREGSPQAIELAGVLKALGGVFGILQMDPLAFRRGGAVDQAGDAAIDDLVAQRQQARKDRDFARADAIRDQLSAMGVVIEDTRDGAVWRRA